MSSLTEELLVELECPVCTDFMSPPIRQCVTGHSFCDSCYQKVNDCPTCRKPKATARSFALEKLYGKLNIPCKNRFDGCSFSDVGKKIKEHEEFCYFGEKGCPLKEMNNCQWFGKMKRVIDHCKTEHPNNVFVDEKQVLTCSNFSTFSIQRSCYHIMFEAYGELFKCCWQLEQDGIIKWCVYFLGDPKNTEHFYYEIEIVDQVSNNKPSGNNLCVRGPCKTYTNENNIFDTKDCLLMHYDIVNQYSKNDEMMYQVKILIVDGVYKLFHMSKLNN